MRKGEENSRESGNELKETRGEPREDKRDCYNRSGEGRDTLMLVRVGH